MSNWKQVGEARDLGMRPEEFERAAAVMADLEIAFEPLRDMAPHEMEPAVVYRLIRQEKPA